MPGLFAGLDVSDMKTAVCIIRDNGDIILETTISTDPTEIIDVLKPYKRALVAVGQESGTKSRWLHRELLEKKFPVVCLDARHTHAALAANPNKTDKNDAWGIATVLARRIYSTAHVKGDEAYRIRTLLTVRKALQRKYIDLQRTRGSLLKANGEQCPLAMPAKKYTASRRKGEEVYMAPLIAALERGSAALDQEVQMLTLLVRRMASEDRVCKRLMTIPGVGPIAALTFRAAVDDAARFKSSRTVAAYFGLAPRTFQSGLTEYRGRISKRGDAAVRVALYDSACVLLSVSKSTWRVRTWGLKLAEARGHKFAAVAVARKLAVIMHRLWITETDFAASSAGEKSQTSRAVRMQRYKQYWTALRDHVGARDMVLANATPPNVQCWVLPIGRSSFSLTLQASERRKWISAEIVAHKDRSKEVFDRLHAKRATIEAAFNGTLDWQRQDDKISSRIVARRQDSDCLCTEEWPEHFAWFLETSRNLRAAFGERLVSLDTPSLRPAAPWRSSYHRSKLQAQKE